MIQGALDRVKPSITRNELGWLATLPDVESRLVFIDRDGDTPRYRAETGPFTAEFLTGLPRRDWTLLVHDVEKHLPEMRTLFDHVNFIPDWRIDDLMVSFAAPGGGVGPHLDNYDVFLCQGTGIRNWKFAHGAIPGDPAASDDLALLEEFVGDQNEDTSQGDVLYLPPGVPHWGVAKRACITYSIGMRAPQKSDFASLLENEFDNEDVFYGDPNLGLAEARPGFISEATAARVCSQFNVPEKMREHASELMGVFATLPKEWLTPESATVDEADRLISEVKNDGVLRVHGMAKVAYDDRHLYVNGHAYRITSNFTDHAAQICANRVIRREQIDTEGAAAVVHWMLTVGGFEIPEEI